jgi:transposase
LNRLPRIWLPTPEERDARQRLKHGDKLVRRQTWVKNPLHFLAMSQGVCRKRKLWSARGRAELEGLSWGSWASHRGGELLDRLDRLGPRIEDLDRAVKAEAEGRPAAARRMEQPGVGPVRALAFVLSVGPVERFSTSRKRVSYLGLNPSERSRGDHQGLGQVSKPGNGMLRWLLVEAAQSAAILDEELREKYRRLSFRRGRNIAKVALARHLAVRLYGMLRQASAARPPVGTPGSPGWRRMDSSPWPV